jgi:septal ring factor EnvC (AmiA/AmiB activator)
MFFFCTQGIIAMTNPTIQTDIAEILKEIKSDQKAMLEEMRSGQKEILKEVSSVKEKVNHLEVSLEAVKGDIKALNTQVDQLDKRISNSELTNRGVLIGLIVVILGGAAKFFGFVNNS